jgi:Protein of unknown function (DUF3176)
MDDERTFLNSRDRQARAAQSPSSTVIAGTDEQQTFLSSRDIYRIASESPSFTEKPSGYSSSAKVNSKRVKYKSLSGASHGAQHLYNIWVTDSWRLEVASLCLALASMGTLIAVLVAYQNKAVPSWRWGLTLNSLLSILSQIITLSTTSILASALSQQKWLWFRNSTRSLKDFSLFDDASKGPWGSLVLLFSKSQIL